MREEEEWRTEGPEGPGLLHTLVAAGMPDWTHLIQPVAPGTSESGLGEPPGLLSGLGVSPHSPASQLLTGELDPRTTTLLLWAVVKTR